MKKDKFIDLSGCDNGHLELELQEEEEGAVSWCYQVLFKKIATNSQPLLWGLTPRRTRYFNKK